VHAQQPGCAPRAQPGCAPSLTRTCSSHCARAAPSMRSLVVSAWLSPSWTDLLAVMTSMATARAPSSRPCGWRMECGAHGRCQAASSKVVAYLSGAPTSSTTVHAAKLLQGDPHACKQAVMWLNHPPVLTAPSPHLDLPLHHARHAAPVLHQHAKAALPVCAARCQHAHVDGANGPVEPVLLPGQNKQHAAT
jgi:hypothetical protein